MGFYQSTKENRKIPTWNIYGLINMPSIDRRKILQSVVGASLLLVGCAQQDSADSQSTTDRTATSATSATSSTVTRTESKNHSTTRRPPLDCLPEQSPEVAWSQSERSAGNTNYASGRAGPSPNPVVRWVVEANVPDIDEIHTPSFIGPAIVDGTVYVGRNLEPGPETPASKEQYLEAYDAVTGDRQFQYRTEAQMWSTPAVAGETVFVTTSGEIHAVSRADGAVQWTRTIDGNGQHLTVSGNKLYYATNSGVHCLDLDGEKVWHVGIQIGGVPSSLALAGDVVYVGTTDGTMVALNAIDGTERWTTGSYRGRVESVTATNCSLLVLANNVLHVLNRDGNPHFRVGNAAGSVATDGRFAFVRRGLDDLVSVDLETRKARWRTERAGLQPHPILVGDTVYVIVDSGILALDAKTGGERWITWPTEFPSPYVNTPKLAAAGGSLFCAMGPYLTALS